MLYIIIGLIILGIIVSIFKRLSELVGGTGNLIVIIIILKLPILKMGFAP